MSASDKPDQGPTPTSIVSDARKSRKQREAGYRERALQLYPWVCGRCAREFSGKKLRELTVHHRDHDHDNNPPDGSNWELLCLYCHDDEHARRATASAYGGASPVRRDTPALTSNPFEELGDLLKREK
jgi:hypothetical protein